MGNFVNPEGLQQLSTTDYDALILLLFQFGESFRQSLESVFVALSITLRRSSSSSSRRGGRWRRRRQSGTR